MPRVWVDGKRVRSPGDGIGRYALAPGEHRVVVGADGFGPAFVDPVISGGADTVAGTVLSAPVVTVGEGVFTLPKPLAASDVTLVRALAATLFTMADVGGVRLVGPPMAGEEVKNALVALGVGRALVTTVPTADEPPLAGIYDVQLAE